MHFTTDFPGFARSARRFQVPKEKTCLGQLRIKASREPGEIFAVNFKAVERLFQSLFKYLKAFQSILMAFSSILKAFSSNLKAFSGILKAFHEFNGSLPLIR